MRLPQWLRIITLFAAGLLFASSAPALAQSAPVAPRFVVNVAVKSPAETQTSLQIVCLFRSDPANQLHGSLAEIDGKLHGLLSRLRNPDLFGGELGETILIIPPAGTLAAQKVLIIGLGDPSSFTPERMYLIGKIAFSEATRLGVAHPFFAPTVLDGGVTRFGTGDVARQVARGFRAALQSEAVLRQSRASLPPAIVDFTFLAGAQHAADARKGIDQAMDNLQAGP